MNNNQTATKVRRSSPWLHTLGAIVRGLPTRLLMRHSWAIDMIILLIGFAIGFYAVVTLLFVEPHVTTPVTTPHLERLDTAALDTLELWMEERQTATENPVKINQPNVFGTGNAAVVN